RRPSRRTKRANGRSCPRRGPRRSTSRSRSWTRSIGGGSHFCGCCRTPTCAVRSCMPDGDASPSRNRSRCTRGTAATTRATLRLRSDVRSKWSPSADRGERQPQSSRSTHAVQSVVPQSIDPRARIGAVHLTISDVGRSVRFYESHLGFTLHHRDERTARLGAGGPDLLVLSACESAPRVRGTTGLYHFAVLVPSRFELARSLRRLVEP